MAFNAKTDWQLNEIVRPEDMNRIEQGILDIDNRLQYTQYRTLSQLGIATSNPTIATIIAAMDLNSILRLPVSSNLNNQLPANYGTLTIQLDDSRDRVYLTFQGSSTTESQAGVWISSWRQSDSIQLKAWKKLLTIEDLLSSTTISSSIEPSLWELGDDDLFYAVINLPDTWYRWGKLSIGDTVEVIYDFGINGFNIQTGPEYLVAQEEIQKIIFVNAVSSTSIRFASTSIPTSTIYFTLN